jgi:hypothetical protein
VPAEQVCEGIAVTGCIASLVSVGDLLTDGVGFGSVELELGVHVGDGELKAADLAEFGGVRDGRIERVTVWFVGLHRSELVGEVAATQRRVSRSTV